MVLTRWVDPDDPAMLIGFPHGYCPHHGEGAPLPYMRLLLAHARLVASTKASIEIRLDGTRFREVDWWKDTTGMERLPLPDAHR